MAVFIRSALSSTLAEIARSWALVWSLVALRTRYRYVCAASMLSLNASSNLPLSSALAALVVVAYKRPEGGRE